MKQKDAIIKWCRQKLIWSSTQEMSKINISIRSKAKIALLKSACGDKILKVIIETCLLTEEEKIKMCEIVTEAGADFIKTSTGFSTSGATFDDIALFKKYVGENVKIKAAGGISSFDDAKKFIELGADALEQVDQ